MKKKLIGSIIFATLFITGCGTTNAINSDTNVTKESRAESGYEVKANKTYLRDWTARSVGGEARPTWLAPLFLGDYSQYKAQFGISDDDVIKVSYISASDVRSAQMRADMQYARQIAKELQQSVNNYATEQSRSGAIDSATKSAIMEVTQAQSSAEITGHEKRTEFYQIIDEEDALTGKVSRKCIMYQVYVIPQTTWARTTATYLKKVLGEMPEELSMDEKAVMDMVNQMMYDARHPTVMSQQEKEQELAYSSAMAQVQVELEPEKQKAAAQQELVKIVQDSRTERTKIMTDAQTKQVQSLADAQTMAALSGNPAVQSASTVTPADANSIDAQNIAYNILFGN
ncbi:MAG: hypothetical protein SPK26_10185 [Treponema sp.]|nr:hypothetical protein [Treponema sp.]